MKSEAGFAHRENKDGSVDAICLGCFQTVATAQLEHELIAKEANHRCSDEEISFLQLHRVRKSPEKHTT